MRPKQPIAPSFCSTKHLRLSYVKRFMYQTLYLFTCRSTQMTQVWWLTQTSNLISRTQFNTMDSTAPFKSKLTVRCESRFSTPFAILDSCANWESRIENKLPRVENRVSQDRKQRFTHDSFPNNFTFRPKL